MKAVIESGGKQYLVSENQVIKLEKLGNTKKGDTLVCDKVLLVWDGQNLNLGKPYIDKAKVTLEVFDTKKGRKVKVVKYKAKTRYHKTIGHRQIYTQAKVKSISLQ